MNEAAKVPIYKRIASRKEEKDRDFGCRLSVVGSG